MTERILAVTRDFEHLPKPSELSLVLSDQPPLADLVTGAFVLAFEGDHLLMTEERDRGWNIVGGGVEPGETPEQAARREAIEEAAARLGGLELLGYQRVRLLGPRPDGYRNPYPDSYLLFFLAAVAALDPFEPNEDASARALIPPADVAGTFWGGFESNRLLHAAALERVRPDGQVSTAP
jgi:8-oxo-dGTP diphosphatase